MTTRIKLLTDHLNFQSDIESCEERTTNNKQNFQSTLNNYIEMMKEHLDMLNVIHDSLSSQEMKSLELKTDLDGSSLILEGDEEILERFIGFGIATEYNSDEESENDSDSDTDNILNDTDSESDSEYVSNYDTDETDF